MLYSFKPRFVPLIRCGDKRQTIRAPRKSRHVRPGQTIHVYTGPRMQPKKVGQAPCLKVLPIHLNLVDSAIQAYTMDESGAVLRIWSTSHAFDDPHPDDLAHAEGFQDYDEMARWFRDTHGAAASFRGVLITWDYTRFYPA